MEVAVEKRLPEIDYDVEDTAEVGLKARKPRHQNSSGGGIDPGLKKVDAGDGEQSENSAYLDKNGGAVEDLDILKLRNTFQYDANINYQNTETVIEETTEESEQIEEEITEEEVVELEFEKAIPKLDTHTMHCPNCDHHITKVVLRRKIIQRRQPQVTEEPQGDLFGCLSCLSLFTTTDNGRFNPFPIFWNKPATQPASNDVVYPEDGNCFSIFRVFRKEKDPEQQTPGKDDQDSENRQKQEKGDQDSQETKPRKLDLQSPPTTEDNKYVANKQPNIIQGENIEVLTAGGPSKPTVQPPISHLPYIGQYYKPVQYPQKQESHVDIPPAASDAIVGQTQVPVTGDSTSFEILKSIVYGGLMEVIASLSVVASAAAGDATTLSIIALALANLVGGIFVIGHNLWDLRDDCYKFANEQITNNQEPHNKYKELLGNVEHFPLHAFFAILSFLVFGIIPPLAYGYSFHETNDRDFTMVVVAAASFLCVGLLAIFKAYINRCNGFWEYVKTIVYYLTTAVTVSGVSYAVGNLVERLIEELGLFDTSSGLAMARLPEIVSTNPSLAYY